MTDAAGPVTARPLLAPAWRRGRLWAALGVAIVLSAFAIAVTRPAPGLTLDPRSPSKDGGKALAELLRGRGLSASRVDALASVPDGSTVLIVSPDSYSAAQLRTLAARSNRVVALGPAAAEAAALVPGTAQGPADAGPITVDPGCSQPEATAAGPVRFPAGSHTYVGPGTSCYGGRVLFDDHAVLLATPGLARNDELANTGVAAILLNVLSGRTSGDRPLAWLLPGGDGAGAGPPSIWSVFPAWSRLALGWLLLVGLLLALWRGRRLGPPVAEQLPVVVRSAEIVEGHGRLYEVAAARDRAAAILRSAAERRLRSRGEHEGAVRALNLAAPPDDPALVAFARHLDEIEARSVPPHKGATL